MTTEKNDLWTLVTPKEEIVLKVLDVQGIPLDPTQYPPNFPIVWQRDPRWKDALLGNLGMGSTIGNAGCALCCLTAWLQWSYGACFDLRLVQQDLHEQNLLVGSGRTMMDWAGLSREWAKANFDASCWQNWSKTPADLPLLNQWLKHGPVIVEVDFQSQTARIDQHFVVAIGWIEDDIALFKRRLWVMDPWIGAVVALPPAYYSEQWDGTSTVRRRGKVARILTGARAVGHAGKIT